MNMIVQISLRDSAFSSFGYIPQSSIAGSNGNSIFNSSEQPPYHFPRQLQHFTFSLGMYMSSSFSTCFPTLVILLFLNSHPSGCEAISHCSLISLMNTDVNHFSCIYWPFFFGEISIQIFCLFLNWVVFLLLCCMSSLCILDTRHLDTRFANIFFHSVGCCFTFLIASFDVQKFSILM